MDNYNSTTSTQLLSPSLLTQAGPFDTISDHQNNDTSSSIQEKILSSIEMKSQDRVRVQHVKNHTNLQNNKCNTFRTFYNNISASSNSMDMEMFPLYQTKENDTEKDVVDLEHLNSTTKPPLHIQNKSAFNIDDNDKYHNNNTIADDISFGNNKNDASEIKETKQNFNFCYKQYNIYGIHNMQSDTAKLSALITESQINKTDSQRSTDQDNAYRHIESVHNYAKSKSFEGDDDKLSPNDSRHSSYLSDDDEDDAEDNDGTEYENDGNIDYEDRLPDDLYADYKDIFSKRGNQSFLNNRELKKSANFLNILKEHKIQINLNNNQIENNCVDEEDHVDIDVETIEPQLSPVNSVIDTNSLDASNFIQDESAASVKPDHHARRPMNAFLIFCKRHRAIVKDRYKNLENRAITKILGDWWASLESTEKKCFTSLAQQNKDAFFSANPNFKWYKLPAPPLRTLTTRPANSFGQEYQDDDGANGVEIISNLANSNYFKLADEAQMGDLSQLMENKSKTIKQSSDLQQALSETSQYMSTHITCNSENLNGNHLKRPSYNENSFSSNSSEEDIIEPKKKNARSCKGKRYQELINSGQITTSLKKSKSLSRPHSGDTIAVSEINIKQNCSNVYNFNNLNNIACPKRSLTASENIMSYDLTNFDLEEKIKELPALDLDDYLQRKRNTKKKKKFSSNGKKKGQRSNNNALARTDKGNKYMATLLQNHELQIFKHHQQQSNTAVGSQKRKARKESITRRDVSIIEEEVSSLLPLTINGCCYFQEAPTAIKYNKDSKIDDITYQSTNFISVSPSVIPVKKNSSSPVSIDKRNSTNVCNKKSLKDNISSSTSDLLILAEVAANRTE